MKKTEIIATRDSPYGGKRYKAGDTRKVTASEARVLVALGHARSKPKEVKPAQTYKRRDMVAEKATTDAPVLGEIVGPTFRSDLSEPRTTLPTYKTKAST